MHAVSKSRLGPRFLLTAAITLPVCLAACSGVDRQRPVAASFARLVGETVVPERARLTARFMGTTTIVLSDGLTTIIIDGFFSRPSLGKLLTGPAEPDRGRIGAGLDAAHVRSASAIFVAHSHHDHAMDAPYVAQLTGAKVVGSRSTRNIALGAELPEDRIAVIGDHSVCRFGAFVVTSFLTPHSRPNLVPGAIDKPLGKSARAWDFKDNGSFAFHVSHPLGNVMIVPSVGLREKWSPPETADTVFLGVGGLKRTARQLGPYWYQFVTGSKARRVYPIHWDSFFKAADRGTDGLVPWRLRTKLRSLRKLANGGPSVLVPPYALPISVGGEAPADVIAAQAAVDQGCRAEPHPVAATSS